MTIKSFFSVLNATKNDQTLTSLRKIADVEGNGPQADPANESGWYTWG